MFKGFLIKFISLVTILLIGSSFAQADSLLTQLPFGILIGKTTNQEIVNRGICTKKIQVSDSYFRCETYSMSGGKFEVGSSESEVVSSVSFRSGSVLPTAWQQMGIRVANKKPSEIWGDNQITQRMAAVSGTDLDNFIAIINSLGAQNVNVAVSDEYDFVETKNISFYIGAYFYNAEFNELPLYHDLPEKDLGLTSLVITENY